MKKYFFLLILTINTSCNAQTSNLMNKENELYHEIDLKRITETNEFVKRGFLSNNNYVELFFNKTGNIVLESSQNSFFSVYKEYYPNKLIKIKGLQLNINSRYSFKKGFWYEFDEKGNLIKETDYDIPFKFTFEDILKFCKNKRIKIDKGPILQSTGWHNKIFRDLENGHPVWEIEHLKKSDLVEIIKLDGITGKVLSTSTYKYINN
ncbi:hypothetical protein [Chryseobacterium contaminans]|nr:hypothetical protein [Chryseobacterium contaminans]SHM01007.1 hypothetical protein SAMN05444407_108160 [Chryseobacterium contaminans]